MVVYHGGDGLWFGGKIGVALKKVAKVVLLDNHHVVVLMDEGEKAVLVEGYGVAFAVKLGFASLCDGHVVDGDGLDLVLLVCDGDGAKWLGFLY